MVDPTVQELQAIVALSVGPDWGVFRGWIERSLAEQRKANDTLLPDRVQWGQGRAQEMSDLLGKLDTSRAVLAKQRRP